MTTSPLIVRAFLTVHANALVEQYDVTVICNVAESNVPLSLVNGVRLVSVRIERDTNPWYDLLALWRLFQIFRRERFDVIHSVSPKAGLLAQLAAYLARVPRRVHTFTGQVWATRSGLGRSVLKLFDRFYAACATHVLVDSPSQREFLLAQKVVRLEKSRVLANGSISGVDTQRFAPSHEARVDVRQRLDIPTDTVLFLYLGRLKRDKGVVDLAVAFAEHAARFSASKLLLIGPDEDRLTTEIRSQCGAHARRVEIVGFTVVPESFLAAADVLCLPSYREGFGSVIIEAGACGIPAIGSRIYGITDAIVDGKTGLLHEPGDRRAIATLLDLLAQDRALRTRMGSEAMERAVRSFRKELLTQALVQFYQLILAKPDNSGGTATGGCGKHYS